MLKGYFARYRIEHDSEANLISPQHQLLGRKP